MPLLLPLLTPLFILPLSLLLEEVSPELDFKENDGVDDDQLLRLDEATAVLLYLLDVATSDDVTSIIWYCGR
jgi:hypothetical protein